MRKLTTSDWVQVVTTAAILISIGLVLVEIRQSREVAQAQLVSDQYALQAALTHTTLGEDAAATLAKACEHPSELTRAESEVMEAWLFSKSLEILRQRQISKQTGFYDESSEWIHTTRGTLSVLLGTAYGRHYWRTVGREYFRNFPEVQEVADEIGYSPSGECGWIDDYPSYISSQKEFIK